MLKTFVRRIKNKISVAIGLFFLTSLLIWGLFYKSEPKIDPRNRLNLDQRIDLVTEIALEKVTRNIEKLTQDRPLTASNYFPSITQPKATWSERFLKNPFQPQPTAIQGEWIYENKKFWASGAFPGLLWKLRFLETDPVKRAFWTQQAKAWSEPLRSLLSKNPYTKDITLNNLIVFQPWYTISQGQERQQQLDSLRAGAKILATPYRKGQGSFQEKIGTFGYQQNALQDQKKHWQAFIDHSINVEQWLWAAAHTPNTLEAKDWQAKAIRHIKTLAAHFDAPSDAPSDVPSNPSGHSNQLRSWQRSFFEDNTQSPRYGQFLFPEGKQGWQDRSVWSRGQAWFIYAAGVTYAESRDPEILAIAKQATNYFLAHLPDRFPGASRRPGDFIAPWDFDYALQKDPDTERDSSASAIALDGMLRLLQVLPSQDPDRARYLKDAQHILYQLTSSDYLPDTDSPEQSILRHGCYHHPQALNPGKGIDDNGLIWGDYYFVDSLVNYRKLMNDV